MYRNSDFLYTLEELLRMAANCISGYPIMLLKFGQFLHNKHVAPTGLSFVEDSFYRHVAPTGLHIAASAFIFL